MKLQLNPEFNLYERAGQAFCDSLQVAETFEKRHDSVLRDIRDLDCSEKFRAHNFVDSSYKSQQNKKQPMCLMTKDGFIFLVMGYRGKKAAAFKEAYINRFNQMESFIKSLVTAKLEFSDFAEAVMLAHEEPKHYHFSTEINMIYRIVLGMDAKAYRAANGIEAGAVIRPYLTLEQIRAVENLQRADIGLIEAGLTYEQRKERLMVRHSRGLLAKTG